MRRVALLWIGIVGCAFSGRSSETDETREPAQVWIPAEAASPGLAHSSREVWVPVGSRGDTHTDLPRQVYVPRELAPPGMAEPPREVFMPAPGAP